MIKLNLLILCLLVSFNLFSQNDIPKVVLTEYQARAVIKDLIRLDALETTNVILNKRIDGLLLKEVIYKEVITTKDTIISNKDKIIDIKNEIIDAKKLFEFHSYAGFRTYNLKFNNPIFYGKAQLEFKKLNIGAQINYQPVILENVTSSFYYNLYIEYKIF